MRTEETPESSSPGIAGPRAWSLPAVSGDASGALADLGVMIPLIAALVLRNGLNVATILICAGLLYVLAGWYFRVPVPVQPVKAAAALAIAQHLSIEVIAAAGMILGVVLFAVSVTGSADRIARFFPLPVVRALQFGVGLVLLRTAYDLVAGDAALVVMAAAAAAVGLAVFALRLRATPFVLGLVVAGVAWSLLSGSSVHLQTGMWRPEFTAGLFDGSTLWLALTLLVLPQLPLTFGNAVVAVVDLERRYFGPAARRVTPGSVSLSCGLANMVTATIGGMPMCHGSNGLTAHYRAGARSYRMNLMIGSSLIVLGAVLGPSALAVIALIPVFVLAVLLGFTAITHGALIADLRGYDLVVAVVAGAAGFYASNLAVTLAVALVGYWGRHLLVPDRSRSGARSERA